MPRKSRGRGSSLSRVRIIGGLWRGRKLSFSAHAGLRPTPDRVRETLFNWLHPRIPGARCLDLFAGSGVLGLEASSRGATWVVLVEQEWQAYREICAHVDRLGAQGVEVILADALAYLGGPAQCFDIVFLDPPFESGILGSCCERLEQGGWLAPGAYLYLEARGRSGLPPLPANWQLVHSKQAGEVGYHLVHRS